MTPWSRLKSFLSALLLRRRADGDLEHELRFHVEERTDTLINRAFRLGRQYDKRNLNLATSHAGGWRRAKPAGCA